MRFEWVVDAFGDVIWIFPAFILGLLSRSVGLPPLVGFLITGFLLNAQGLTNTVALATLSDLGITLLLFTVGLKLNLQTLSKPQVWGVTGLHTSIVIVLFGCLALGLAMAGLPVFSDLSTEGALLLAFALSFSSTVFVVKVLEDKGEMTSLHGRIAIGILIVQDIVAVVFLAISAGKWPSLWAILVVLLIPLRVVLQQLLSRVGHGELLVLYGFLLALGGAQIFEMVGLKGDLGALILGVLMANHPKSEELAKTMLGFKDLFLLGFFLSVGMSGDLTFETLIIGVLIVPLVFFKSVLFFALFTGFRLRSRTALMASVNLSNYSEFGLIVIAIGVASGWIANEWLTILAIALALSFVIASALNKVSHQLYSKRRISLQRFQKRERLGDDQPVDVNGATIAIIGMGRIGSGAFDKMRDLEGNTVVGVDIDPLIVSDQREAGRRVVLGDPSDADFWDRIQAAHSLELVMLALPKLSSNLEVLGELKATSYTGKIAATAKFPDEVAALVDAGATTVFNVYTEAGAGFAAHVVDNR
ncbi:MAG: putative Kef-type K+ transport protein [Candidatus Azotimanducaceae bacterium]|jgi:predicted Kef-type K+ transport protein